MIPKLNILMKIIPWGGNMEKDLGVKGATFEQLRDELLRLNKKATLDTPFYVNLLEPMHGLIISALSDYPLSCPVY